MDLARLRKLSGLESLHEGINFNPLEPNNPDVIIPGYGIMTLTQLESNIERSLLELVSAAKEKNWSKIEFILASTISTKVKAVNDAYAELEHIRARGGKRSAGINKEI